MDETFEEFKEKINQALLVAVKRQLTEDFLKEMYDEDCSVEFATKQVCHALVDEFS